MNKQIYILDTTLRDGQQSPGAGMSFADNVRYAHLASQLKIDILEAGFPASSKTDFAIVNTIAREMVEINSPIKIAALCQLREEQVEQTMEALLPSLTSGCGRVHIYVPVDPQLMLASLGKLAENKLEIVNIINRLTTLIVKNGFEVQFSPEGYSRQGDNFDFTTDVICAAVSGGASVINCPDTIGGSFRYEGDRYFVNLIKCHAEIVKQQFPDKDVIWSAHCHNDFGNALDNTLTAVFDGIVQQIEGCINGVGERAGNVALEQCIMNIHHYGNLEHINHKVYTNVDISYLKQISDFVAEKMLPRQYHWPITGINATAHTSGGHTNAILKNPLVYQPFDPKMIGSQLRLVFGPLSGSNHAQQIILSHNYICEDYERAAITQAIKDYYYDRRKGITEEELIIAYKIYRAPIKIKTIAYAKCDDAITTLSLHGKFFDKEDLIISYKSKGSALTAVNQAVMEYLPGITIENYHSRAAGKGIDALCLSEIVISLFGNSREQFIGKASDDDIEISAIKAFISAVNEAYIEQNYVQKII